MAGQHDHREHDEAAKPEAVRVQYVESYRDFGRGLGVVDAKIVLEGSDEPKPWTFFVSNPYVSALPWGWKDGKVWVLMARSVKAAAGRMWDACEGGISGGRDPRQSIVKELADELGLRVSGRDLVFVGNFFQQSDRQLEADLRAGHQPVPKRARVFLAKVEPEKIDTDSSDGQRLDEEEFIRPKWMLLQDAIEAVEASAKGENDEIDLGASPILLMLLYRLERMERQGEADAT